MEKLRCQKFLYKTWQKELTRKLGRTIMRIRQENLALLIGGLPMNKEEILKKTERRIRIRISMSRRF